MYLIGRNPDRSGSEQGITCQGPLSLRRADLRAGGSLEVAIATVWPAKDEKNEEGELVSYGGDWVAMVEGRAAKRRLAIEQIAKPVLFSSDWRNPLLDL